MSSVGKDAEKSCSHFEVGCLTQYHAVLTFHLYSVGGSDAHVRKTILIPNVSFPTCLFLFFNLSFSKIKAPIERNTQPKHFCNRTLDLVTLLYLFSKR